MSPAAADFDPYHDRYEELVQQSIAFSGLDHRFFLEAKVVRLLDIVSRRQGDPTRVRALDVGCGAGSFDGLLEGKLGRLEGVDVSEAMVDNARRANPGVEYQVAAAADLPFADRAFDLVFASCLLHHVTPPDRDAVLSELRRVTRPGGLVVVIEHNPLNPLTRLAVGRCEFDEGVKLLGRRETLRRLASAGLRPVESRYFLLLPWAGRVASAVERVLAPVPLGAQYYVAAHA